MKSIIIVLFLLFVNFPILSLADTTQGKSLKGATEKSPLNGDWIMHIYIGQKVFHDQLHLEVDSTGNMQGTLTVPNVFSTKVLDFQQQDSQFSFKIKINEGSGWTTILYTATMHASKLAFSGFAVTEPDGELVGGFTAQPAVFGKNHPSSTGKN